MLDSQGCVLRSLEAAFANSVGCGRIAKSAADSGDAAECMDWGRRARTDVLGEPLARDGALLPRPAAPDGRERRSLRSPGGEIVGHARLPSPNVTHRTWGQRTPST